MPTLNKIVEGLLESIIKRDAITKIQLIAIIDTLPRENLISLVKKIKLANNKDSIGNILTKYSALSVDNILIYYVTTKNNHEYIVLIEDLEELTHFHTLLAFVSLNKDN